MSTTEFQGNIPVSTAKQVFRGVQLDREDFLKQAVLDHGITIREEGEFPVQDNSEILSMGFPEGPAVKGLVHDTTLNHYSKEPGFRNLGVNPSADQIHEMLEGSITGEKDSSPELRNTLNELETGYDVKPEKILRYRFESGETVSTLLRQIAEYRAENWEEQTEGFHGVVPEVSVFASNLSGRTDLVYRGSGERNPCITEIKISEQHSIYDEFQASAYWLMNGDDDAEVLIDYPLIDERLRFDPEEDQNDFDPREFAFDVYRSRDKAREVIEDFRELQDTYFELYDSRKKATREALRDLEVR